MRGCGSYFSSNVRSQLRTLPEAWEEDEWLTFATQTAIIVRGHNAKGGDSSEFRTMIASNFARKVLDISSSHRRLGSVRADAGDAERAPSRERVVVPTERRRPRRACTERAVDTRACRVSCAPSCVE